jgi:hypothetical protein
LFEKGTDVYGFYLFNIEELLLNCSLLLSSLLTYNNSLVEIVDEEKLRKAVMEAIKQTK